MPNLHEVGTQFVRRAASVVAVLISAGPTASADDARPSEPPKVSTPPVVTYAEPPNGPPLLDNDLQAIPLLGPAYIAVETKYTALAGGGGLLVGGQAGWTFDPGLRFGFAGYGLVAATALAGADGQSTSVQLAYGGLRAAYVLRPRDLVHLTLATLVGIGSVGTVTSDPRTSASAELGSPLLFALEPQLEVEMNLSYSVHLAATASYRYLANPDLPRLDSGAVSGLAGGLAIEVGAL